MERWLEIDALKNKALHAYDKEKNEKIREKRTITFSLYQKALEYAKNKSLEESDFMKKISEYRDQSKEQLNKLLSSSIEAKNANISYSSFKQPQKIEKELKKEFEILKKELSSSILSQREEFEILKNELSSSISSQREEFKILKNELCLQMKEILVELSSSKTEKDQATNK